MLVYLTMIGKQGFEKLSKVSAYRAHYLVEKLKKIDGVKLKFDQKFFNEFVIELDVPATSLHELMKGKNILAGIEIARMYPQLKDCLLVAVTEMNSASELGEYAKALEQSIKQLKKGVKSNSKKLAATSS